METRFYRICGLTTAVTASEPLPPDGECGAFRTDAAAPALTIELTPADELSVPDGPPLGTAGEKQLWRSGSRVVRLTKDRFRPHPHLRSEYDLSDPGRVQVQVRREYWPWAAGCRYLWSGVALNQLLLHRRCLLFHASLVETAEGGILFTAASGVGKSTQAELWRRYRGAEILNGDKAGISLREAPMAHGLPFSGTSGICRNRSVPLRGVAVLSQAADNSARLLTPSQAAAALCPNCFADPLVGEEWSLALNLLLDLTEAVPVLALACTPELRAVETLETALREAGR